MYRRCIGASVKMVAYMYVGEKLEVGRLQVMAELCREPLAVGVVRESRGPAALKPKNNPDAEALIREPFRKGWEI